MVSSMSRDDVALIISNNQLLAAKLKAASTVVNTWGMLCTGLPTIASIELESAARAALEFIAEVRRE